MSVTVPCGNLCLEESNIAWFYMVNSPKVLDEVQPGWYAHGPGLENAVVTDVSKSVDNVWTYVTIEKPSIFRNQSTNYVFTSFKVEENENTVKMTATFNNVSETASNTAWFYVGTDNKYLQVVKPGWYVQGKGLVNVKVTEVNNSVDNKLVFISINEPNTFHNKGTGYVFTSVPMNRAMAMQSGPIVGFNMWSLLENVEIGWYAQGPDVKNAVVDAIDLQEKKLSITGSGQKFSQSNTYYFSNVPIA
jgi:hypothetical protein